MCRGDICFGHDSHSLCNKHHDLSLLLHSCTKRANVHMAHIQVQNGKKCVMLLKYTPVTQSILHSTFSNVWSTHTTFKLQWTRNYSNNLQFYHSDKTRQGHQSWYELVDLQVRLCIIIQDLKDVP